MDDKNNNEKKEKNQKNKQFIILLVITAIVTLFSISVMNKFVKDTTTQEITYNEFMEMLENDEIESVEYDSNKITIIPKEQKNSMIKMTYYTCLLYTSRCV